MSRGLAHRWEHLNTLTHHTQTQYLLNLHDTIKLCIIKHRGCAPYTHWFKWCTISLLTYSTFTLTATFKPAFLDNEWTWVYQQTSLTFKMDTEEQLFHVKNLPVGTTLRSSREKLKRGEDEESLNVSVSKCFPLFLYHISVIFQVCLLLKVVESQPWEPDVLFMWGYKGGSFDREYNPDANYKMKTIKHSEANWRPHRIWFTII